MSRTVGRLTSPWGGVATVVASALVFAACVGDIGGSANDRVGGPNDPLVKQTHPAPGGLRRLTARQYTASIDVLFGQNAAAVAAPPADAQLHGLEVIGGAELSLPDKGIAQYESSARAIAAVVLGDQQLLGSLLPCTPSGPGDEACFRQFVQQIGRLVWRRGLDDGEVQLLSNVGVFSATHPDVNDFNVGLGEVLSAMLQSPNFVYIVEIGTPEPSDKTKRWLNDSELATRMSFFLLGATPDATILDFATSHDMRDLDVVRELARQMLDVPRAQDSFADFYDELYRLRELDGLSKDQAAYPGWNPALATAMRLETLFFIHDVVWTRNADARELFTANYTFADATLAGLYGLNVSGDFESVVLPEGQGRSGLLGHASWLTRFSHPATTSPTRRGLFVRTALLCDEIPPPPPGVEIELPAGGAGQPMTKKQKLTQHQEDPQCASCHVLMDNIGLALENYDAIGVYRTEDEGLPIDPVSDASDLGKFSSAAELGALIAGDPRSMGCIVKSLFRGSMGHLETDGESASIEALEEAFANSDYRVQDLLVELVSSPAFRLVADPK